MQARLTDERSRPGANRLAALVAVLGAADEETLGEVARAIAAWEGVRRVSIRVCGPQADGDPLLVTAGHRLRAVRPPICRELVDGCASLGRLEVWPDGSGDPAAVEDDCTVAARMLALVVGRHRLETALVEAQAYQVVGQIAAGLVHDFNNVLTGISGNAAVAHAMAASGSGTLAPIQRIEDAARDAAGIARALLNFVRGSLRREPLSINELAIDTRRVLRRSVRDGVAVTLDLQDGLPWVEGERALLQQALVNLVLNGAQAIEGDGCVTIRTHRVERLSDSVEGNPRAASSYVALAVSDTGRGVAQEARHQVFQPFFTTKGSAGTGLGLASVMQVARRHGGGIVVESAPGAGATFTLYLPVPEDAGRDQVARQTAE